MPFPWSDWSARTSSHVAALEVATGECMSRLWPVFEDNTSRALIVADFAFENPSEVAAAIRSMSVAIERTQVPAWADLRPSLLLICGVTFDPENEPEIRTLSDTTCSFVLVQGDFVLRAPHRQMGLHPAQFDVGRGMQEPFEPGLRSSNVYRVAAALARWAVAGQSDPQAADLREWGLAVSRTGNALIVRPLDGSRTH